MQMIIYTVMIMCKSTNVNNTEHVSCYGLLEVFFFHYHE